MIASGEYFEGGGGSSVPCLLLWRIRDTMLSVCRERSGEGKERVRICQGLFQKRDATPPPEHRSEALDTRSSRSCRGRVVVNACLGWSYG